MNLRTLKRRRDAQTTRWALAFAPDAEGWRLADDDDLREFFCGPDDDMPDDVCLHCRGDGMDPDCDYLLPCPDCGAPL